MKRIDTILILYFLLISSFAVGQKTTTLPSGNTLISIYKNKATDQITAGSLGVGAFEVMASKRKQDSLYAVLVAGLDLKVDKVTGKGLSTEDYTSAEKSKLAGIAAGATANSSDATLLNRTNHTGSQAISTVTGLQTALDGKQASLGFTPENAANRAIANGYASLDGSGRVPLAQLPTGTQTYVGTWNASTNTPTLANGSGTLGQYYIVNVPGTQNLGAGSDTYALGDNVIYSGSVWEKVPNSGGVTAVNGMTGSVSLTTANIPESGNLYYTESRVNANTNVAANTAARHGAVTLGTANGLSLSTQQLSLGLASTSTTGALSSTDWNTFNEKQPAGSYLTTSAAASTYEPIFSKNTGFNKNFGTASGTVAQGNDSRINNGQTAFGWGNHAGLYPTYNGTGATGTWGINISGNAATASDATTWAGNGYDGTSSMSTAAQYLLGYDSSLSKWRALNGAGILATIGSPSGGETIGSVAARGNISSLPLIVNSNDQSTARIKVENSTAGKTYSLVAGTPNVDNNGLSIFDETANLTRLHITTGGNVGIGTPTAPTPAPGTNTTQIPTTAFVQAAIAASVVSGTYTPTLTGGSNTATISNSGVAHYTRIGNEVTVSGHAIVTATAASTTTYFLASLPIASNFSNGQDAVGVVSVNWNSGTGTNAPANPIGPNANVGLDEISMGFTSGPSVGGSHQHLVWYTYMYTVK